MKAINVLRGFLSESPSAVYPDEVLGHVDAIERELEERYVELPVDGDGVSIHLLDRLKVDGEIGVFVVGNMTRCTDGWLVGTNRGQIVRPEKDAHHYYKPPTVEDVLEKALNEAAMLDRKEGYWPSAADITNLVNELAPKLQLREAE